jgi:hypothetical protein
MTAAPLPVIVGQPSTAAVDASGVGLTYAWSSPDCPTIVFATPAVAATSFVLPAAVPPNADPVSCTLQVDVSAGPLAVNTGTLVVPVGPVFVNHPPVIISVAQDVLGGVVGDVVTMTAVAYDLDNDLLEALWTVTPIDSSVLGAGTFVESTLTVPSTWTATNTLTLACTAPAQYQVTVDIFDVLTAGGTPLSAGDQFTFVVGCAP